MSKKKKKKKNEKNGENKIEIEIEIEIENEKKKNEVEKKKNNLNENEIEKKKKIENENENKIENNEKKKKNKNENNEKKNEIENKNNSVITNTNNNNNEENQNQNQNYKNVGLPINFRVEDSQSLHKKDNLAQPETKKNISVDFTTLSNEQIKAAFDSEYTKDELRKLNIVATEQTEFPDDKKPDYCVFNLTYAADDEDKDGHKKGEPLSPKDLVAAAKIVFAAHVRLVNEKEKKEKLEQQPDNGKNQELTLTRYVPKCTHVGDTAPNEKMAEKIKNLFEGEIKKNDDDNDDEKDGIRDERTEHLKEQIALSKELQKLYLKLAVLTSKGKEQNKNKNKNKNKKKEQAKITEEIKEKESQLKELLEKSLQPEWDVGDEEKKETEELVDKILSVLAESQQLQKLLPLSWKHNEGNNVQEYFNKLKPVCNGKVDYSSADVKEQATEKLAAMKLVVKIYQLSRQLYARGGKWLSKDGGIEDLSKQKINNWITVALGNLQKGLRTDYSVKLNDDRLKILNDYLELISSCKRSEDLFSQANKLAALKLSLNAATSLGVVLNNSLNMVAKKKPKKDKEDSNAASKKKSSKKELKKKKSSKKNLNQRVFDFDSAVLDSILTNEFDKIFKAENGYKNFFKPKEEKAEIKNLNEENENNENNENKIEVKNENKIEIEKEKENLNQNNENLIENEKKEIENKNNEIKNNLKIEKEKENKENEKNDEKEKKNGEIKNEIKNNLKIENLNKNPNEENEENEENDKIENNEKIENKKIENKKIKNEEKEKENKVKINKIVNYIKSQLNPEINDKNENENNKTKEVEFLEALLRLNKDLNDNKEKIENQENVLNWLFELPPEGKVNLYNALYEIKTGTGSENKKEIEDVKKSDIKNDIFDASKVYENLEEFKRRLVLNNLMVMIEASMVVPFMKDGRKEDVKNWRDDLVKQAKSWKDMKNTYSFSGEDTQKRQNFCSEQERLVQVFVEAIINEIVGDDSKEKIIWTELADAEEGKESYLSTINTKLDGDSKNKQNIEIEKGEKLKDELNKIKEIGKDLTNKISKEFFEINEGLKSKLENTPENEEKNKLKNELNEKFNNLKNKLKKVLGNQNENESLIKEIEKVENNLIENKNIEIENEEIEKEKKIENNLNNDNENQIFDGSPDIIVNDENKIGLKNLFFENVSYGGEDNPKVDEIIEKCLKGRILEEKERKILSKNIGYFLEKTKELEQKERKIFEGFFWDFYGKIGTIKEVEELLEQTELENIGGALQGKGELVIEKVFKRVSEDINLVKNESKKQELIITTIDLLKKIEKFLHDEGVSKESLEGALLEINPEKEKVLKDISIYISFLNLGDLTGKIRELNNKIENEEKKEENKNEQNKNKNEKIDEKNENKDIKKEEIKIEEIKIEENKKNEQIEENKEKKVENNEEIKNLNENENDNNNKNNLKNEKDENEKDENKKIENNENGENLKEKNDEEVNIEEKVKSKIETIEKYIFDIFNSSENGEDVKNEDKIEEKNVEKISEIKFVDGMKKVFDEIDWSDYSEIVDNQVKIFNGLLSQVINLNLDKGQINNLYAGASLYFIDKDGDYRKHKNEDLKMSIYFEYLRLMINTLNIVYEDGEKKSESLASLEEEIKQIREKIENVLSSENQQRSIDLNTLLQCFTKGFLKELKNELKNELENRVESFKPVKVINQLFGKKDVEKGQNFIKSLSENSEQFSRQFKITQPLKKFMEQPKSSQVDFLNKNENEALLIGEDIINWINELLKLYVSFENVNGSDAKDNFCSQLYEVFLKTAEDNITYLYNALLSLKLNSTKIEEGNENSDRDKVLKYLKFLLWAADKFGDKNDKEISKKLKKWINDESERLVAECIDEEDGKENYKKNFLEDVAENFQEGSQKNNVQQVSAEELKIAFLNEMLSRHNVEQNEDNDEDEVENERQIEEQEQEEAEENENEDEGDNADGESKELEKADVVKEDGKNLENEQKKREEIIEEKKEKEEIKKIKEYITTKFLSPKKKLNSTKKNEKVEGDDNKKFQWLEDLFNASLNFYNSNQEERLNAYTNVFKKISDVNNVNISYLSKALLDLDKLKKAGSNNKVELNEMQGQSIRYFRALSNLKWMCEQRERFKENNIEEMQKKQKSRIKFISLLSQLEKKEQAKSKNEGKEALCDATLKWLFCEWCSEKEHEVSKEDENADVKKLRQDLNLQVERRKNKVEPVEYQLKKLFKKAFHGVKNGEIVLLEPTATFSVLNELLEVPVDKKEDKKEENNFVKKIGSFLSLKKEDVNFLHEAFTGFDEWLSKDKKVKKNKTYAISKYHPTLQKLGLRNYMSKLVELADLQAEKKYEGKTLEILKNILKEDPEVIKKSEEQIKTTEKNIKDIEQKLAAKKNKLISIEKRNVFQWLVEFRSIIGLLKDGFNEGTIDIDEISYEKESIKDFISKTANKDSFTDLENIEFFYYIVLRQLEEKSKGMKDISEDKNVVENFIASCKTEIFATTVSDDLKPLSAKEMRDVSNNKLDLEINEESKQNIKKLIIKLNEQGKKYLLLSQASKRFFEDKEMQMWRKNTASQDGWDGKKGLIIQHKSMLDKVIQELEENGKVKKILVNYEREFLEKFAGLLIMLIKCELLFAPKKERKIFIDEKLIGNDIKNIEEKIKNLQEPAEEKNENKKIEKELNKPNENFPKISWDLRLYAEWYSVFSSRYKNYSSKTKEEKPYLTLEEWIKEQCAVIDTCKIQDINFESVYMSDEIDKKNRMEIDEGIKKLEKEIVEEEKEKLKKKKLKKKKKIVEKSIDKNENLFFKSSSDDMNKKVKKLLNSNNKAGEEINEKNKWREVLVRGKKLSVAKNLNNKSNN